MRIPIFYEGPWLAAAVTIAVAAALLFAHQGAANAGAGLPGTPANPLAHLIVPEGGDPRVRVSWDALSAPVPGYTITRDDGQAFQAAGTATTFSDHSVEPGTSYTYTVMARNEQGFSPASATASASVPEAPGEPGGLAAELAEIEAADEAASVTLTWTASTVPAAAQCEVPYPLLGYTVLRSDGGQETEISTPGKGATSFTDDNAAFSTTYTYRVMARNAIGNSPAAETAVTVPARPVLPPTAVSASISDPFDGTVTVSWEEPAQGPEVTGYQVLRNDRGAAATVLADNVTANAHTDSAAEDGVPYSYAVRARSADNISDESASADIEAPAPPSGLTATVGEGVIDLSWSAPTAGTVAGYRLERRDEQGGWQDPADVTQNSHSDDTAQANVEYRYRVQHRNRHGGSTWAESEPVTMISLPGRPAGLTATVEGDDNVLAWTAPDSPFIDGYRVRHATGDGDWHKLAEAITGTTYRHEGAQADVTHRYAVQAHNSAGNGPWSDPASATRVTPPAVPQNVSAEIDGDDIVLTWERPGTVHVNGYTVSHQAGDADPVESDLIPEAQTAFRLTDATGDVAYRIAVRAHNDAGDSPWSEDVEIMRRLAPSAPTNFAAAVGESDIVLSWGAPETGTADGYRVHYGEQDAGSLETVNRAANETSFTHSDNTEGVTYQYRVRAHNTAGESAWSETLTASRTLAPAAPAELAAAVSGSAITVSWTAPQAGIVDTYQVQYGVSGSDETTTASVNASETSFTHLGATGDITHSYQVRSVNSAGSSPWAGPVSAMWVIPPGVPTGVTAAISGDDILVSWTRPAGNFIDEYRVQFREQNTERWNSATVAAAQTSHRHTGPTPGATHEYRVRAENAGGVSQWSEIATGVWYRTAAPPKKFTLTPFGTQLFVQWPKSETPGVTGYQLRYRIDSGEWQYQDTTLRLYFADWSTDQTLHEYQVRALKDKVAGDWSAIERATVTTPAAVPALTFNREGASSVRLHWEKPASGQSRNYIVQTKEGNPNEYTIVGATGGHITTIRMTTGYNSETTYRVLAQNHFGIKGPQKEGVTAHVVMPAAERQWENAPRDLEARMLDPTTVRLTWNPPQERAGQVTNYRIYRKLASDSLRIGDSYRDHVLVAYTRGPSTSHIDHSAQAGVAYEYTVKAYRNGYSSPWGANAPLVYATPWE